jgi:hypothetical protein
MAKVDGKDVNLLNYSAPFRNRELVRNQYKNTAQYNATHPNAQSDGDELGKGDKGGTIGGATDIRQREYLLAKNFYGKNNPYDASKG